MVSSFDCYRKYRTHFALFNLYTIQISPKFSLALIFGAASSSLSSFASVHDCLHELVADDLFSTGQSLSHIDATSQAYRYTIVIPMAKVQTNSIL